MIFIWRDSSYPNKPGVVTSHNQYGDEWASEMAELHPEQIFFFGDIDVSAY